MRALRSAGVNRNTSSNFRLFRSSAGKVLGGIAGAEARIEERKTGIESPNYRGFSRLARRDYKEKRDGGRVYEILRCTAAAAGINVCTCSVPEIQAKRSPGAETRLRKETWHCALSIEYIWKVPRCEAAMDSRNSKHRQHTRGVCKLIFTQ